MDKLVKRTAQAQRQAGRKAMQEMKTNDTTRKYRLRYGQTQAVEEIRQNLKAARQFRKDLWEMGPLAPKRDVGLKPYDVIDNPTRLDWTGQGLHQPKAAVVAKRCAWAGGAKQLNIAVDDRVVILDGPDQGKIDRIRSIDIQSGTVTLQKYHQAIATAGLGAVQVQSTPIPISSIRLVYPLAHPKTGITRDVIINELKAVPPNMQSPNMSFDRWEYGNKWDRVVPGLNVVIPWPDVTPPTFQTHPKDTARDQVEERTFFYGLLSPPMPEVVIDELRNKYSKFRTRHETWYIEKKEAEAQAKQKRAETIKSMQTPLEEFHEKRRELRAAQGEPELSDAMLEKLGEIIASKKLAAQDKTGVSEASTSS